ncbi:MAG TPA: hypothetical protein VF017_14165 [Thermoanaerobaculia bacterium]|nr:hypothetical protein [Thermoanaerobaculia bacterium]
MLKRSLAPFLFSLFSCVSALAAPTLTFATPNVVLSGLSPGGSAILLALSRDTDEGIAIVKPVDEALADGDSDGVVTLDLGGDPVLRSIWVGIDLATGDGAVATPPEFPLAYLADPLVSLDVKPTGDEVRVARLYVQAWWVRPGVGAWGLAQGDGGALDQTVDGDGQVAMQISTMEAVGGTPPPGESAAAGDWVVVIDPRTMELYTGEVEAGTSATAPLRLRPVVLPGSGR